MTSLEIFLILTIYIISGSFFSYKQKHSSEDIAAHEKQDGVIFAFFFWPILFFVLIIKKIIINQW